MTKLKLVGRSVVADDKPSKTTLTRLKVIRPDDIDDVKTQTPKIVRTHRCLYEQRQVSSTATRCAFCGRTADRYEAHHAVPLVDGGPQTEAEGAVLTALCHECHLIAHAIRKATVR